MTRVFIAASLAALVGIAGCAGAKDAYLTPVKYTVVRENVTIPFSRNVLNFRVGADKTLLLEGTGRRWYRATLDQPCTSDLQWEQAVSLYDRSGTGVSKFSEVIVDGQRCQIQTLDEIADPRVAEAAARTAPPVAAQPAS